MPDLLDVIDIKNKEARNVGSSAVLPIPRDMRKTAYLTGTANYNPREFNEPDSNTTTGNLLGLKAIFCITSSGEIDLAPAMSLREAAEVAKRLIAGLPNNIIDADLGPDL